MNEQELWEWMMDAKASYTPARAFATLSRDIVMKRWNGHGAKPEYTEVSLRAGTRVNVVMASQFGDVGITNDLSVEHGYDYRTQCVECDGPFGHIEPAGLLTSIEKVGQ